jgi:hypothetical protein
MTLRRIYRPTIRPRHVWLSGDVVASSGLCTRAAPRFRESCTDVDILAHGWSTRMD